MKWKKGQLPWYAIYGTKIELIIFSGKEYGTASIEIHLKSCKKKWEQQESFKPKKDRRPLPAPPASFGKITSAKIGEAELLAYNEEAFDDYNTKALVPCPNCTRTFLPDRLEVHLRSCNKTTGSGKKTTGGLSSTMPARSTPIKSVPKATHSPAPPQRPKTLICYIWYSSLNT